MCFARGLPNKAAGESSGSGLPEIVTIGSERTVVQITMVRMRELICVESIIIPRPTAGLKVVADALKVIRAKSASRTK